VDHSGKLKFVFDDREIVVGAGEFLLIPPNVPHSAIAEEDTVDVDIFAPRRETGSARKTPTLGNRQPASANGEAETLAAAVASKWKQSEAHYPTRYASVYYGYGGGC